MIRVEEFITPAMVEVNPDWYFVFGDNARRVGKGGQAAIRDYPNTLGIRTKWAPSTSRGSYFTDDDFVAATNMIAMDFTAIHSCLIMGKTVVFPLAGIGTGRAELATRAPKIYEYLNQTLAELLLNWYTDDLP